MAGKISEMDAAGTITGAEKLELLQGGDASTGEGGDNVRGRLDGVLPGAWTFVDVAGGSRTLELADASVPWAPKIIRMQHGTANTVTVPPNSSVAFAVGAQVNVLHDGAGTLEFDEGSGVTVRPPPGGTLDSLGEGGMFCLVKRGTDTWQLIGPTEAA